MTYCPPAEISALYAQHLFQGPELVAAMSAHAAHTPSSWPLNIPQGLSQPTTKLQGLK